MELFPMSMSMSGNLAVQESYQPRLVPGQTAVLAGAGNFVIEDQPFPSCEANEVLIQLEGCGVCSSNLPVWEGRPWFTYPLEAGAPGHEGWGRVEAVGDAVADVRPGQRVAGLSYHAFADADVADASQVVVLPEARATRPFPGGALGCAWHVCRRAEVQAGHAVAIVGVGFLGALLVQLCAREGARVIALGRRPFALEMARRFGASETVVL